MSGAELAAIAFAVDQPMDWCFSEPPAGFSRVLDRALDNVARDVAFLLDDGLLPVSAHVPRRAPRTVQDAENLARSVRSEAGRPDGPLTDLQAVSENLGLLGFSLPLGRDATDAADAAVGAAGVAVINGSAGTRRRRFSLAHELGHHLTGDPYEPSPRLDGPGTERMLNALDRRPYVVAESLAELQGPTRGTVTLPHHLDWSGDPVYDLDSPSVLASMYRTVLNEARSTADLTAWLDGKMLIRLWSSLWLPERLRGLWEGKFSELAATAARGV